MAGQLSRYKGQIISIKEKMTKKGVAIGVMIESAKGNKAWFLCWEAPWAAVSDGRITPLVYEDQDVEILSPPPDPGRNSVQKDEKTGGVIVFLAPNPKLEKAGPVTAGMKKKGQYIAALELFDNKRLGKAMALFATEMHQWLEDRDREFVESLAEGARKYDSITDNQRPFVVKILARYAANHSRWGKIVDESIKNAAAEPDEYGEPEAPVQISEEDF